MEMKQKFDPLVAEWVSFSTQSKFNLVEKCLKLSQILEYPDLDISKYIQKINEMGKTLQMEISNVDNPTYKISMLNEHLFQRYGFRGDTDDYYNPKNNFINEVLEKKSGIPISLSIIYSEVAKHIGLDIKIVGFPSHVIVKYNEEILLDPFNKGKLLKLDDLEQILDKSFDGQVDFYPEFLDEISTDKIVIRMLRNLKNSYGQSFAYEKAMRCTNMILSLEPNSPEEIRDKGILEDRFLNHDLALELLEKYLEQFPEAEDADFILELIRNIRNKINQ